MAFTDYPGFTITTDPGIKRPKGVPRRKKQFADRGFIRGDRITTTEQAIWLNPRYREENRSEILANFRHS